MCFMIIKILKYYKYDLSNSFMTESKSMDWFLYDNGLRNETVK